MEKFYMAAMGGADGLGNKSIELLVKFFGSAKAAWFADSADLWKSGVRKNSLEAFIAWRKKFPDAPENLVSYCDRQKIKLCSFFDDDYPPLLKEIDSPPMILFYKGNLKRINFEKTRIVWFYCFIFAEEKVCDERIC